MRPEFRTPLHSIISFVEMLQNRTLGLIGGTACVWGNNNKANCGETLLLQISAINDLAQLEVRTITLIEALIDPTAILDYEISAATAREIGISYYLAPSLPAIRTVYANSWATFWIMH